MVPQRRGRGDGDDLLRKWRGYAPSPSAAGRAPDLPRPPPAARLLRYAAPAVHYLSLALYLVVQGAVDGAEAVHVLHFYLAAEPAGAQGPDGHVGVAREGPPPHIAGAGFQ